MKINNLFIILLLICVFQKTAASYFDFPKDYRNDSSNLTESLLANTVGHDCSNKQHHSNSSNVEYVNLALRPIETLLSLETIRNMQNNIKEVIRAYSNLNGVAPVLKNKFIKLEDAMQKAILDVSGNWKENIKFMHSFLIRFIQKVLENKDNLLLEIILLKNIL